MLETAGPFDRRAYREAWLRTQPNIADASFGARLPDGTGAAIALVREGRVASWPPLGYSSLVASAPLTEQAERSFLAAARAAAGVSSLGFRHVAWTESPPHDGGRQVGITSVVDLSGESDPSAGLAKKARQSIRRAERARATPAPPDGRPDRFLALYGPAARERGAEYPESVIRSLTDAGLARFYDVLIDGEPVSSAMALVGSAHWMYWAAAQNQQGREVEAGYLAALAMLEDARDSGAQAINLGASASGGVALEGVAQFKRRLGGKDVPVLEQWIETPAGRAKRSLAGALRFIKR
jgi:hypothetical protein